MSRRVGLALTYHRVASDRNLHLQCVTPRHFAEQMRALRDVADIVPVSALAARGSGSAVSVTFDDGYADVAANAAPVLRSERIPATVFVVTGDPNGGEFWWDRLEHLLIDAERLPRHIVVESPGCRLRVDVRSEAGRLRAVKAFNHRLRVLPLDRIETVLDEIAAQAGDIAPCEVHRRMTREEVVALADGGLIEIGGHTRTHTMLSALPSFAQRDEVAGCRHDLEMLVGRVSDFAYPFGVPHSHDRHTLEQVRDAGFQRAFLNTPGLIDRRTPRFTMPRRMVYDWPGDEFARRIARWLEEDDFGR